MEAFSAAPRRSTVGAHLPRSHRLLAALGDDRLVEQVRRGNDAAFEAIFERYHRSILAFCRHMLASVEEAEDAVQHTFAQAYDAIRRGDRELKLKAWLYTIARNRCLSILRARREQAAELEDVPTAGLSDAVQQRAELRELLADLRELPEDQRAALVLSEMGDLSHVEIAAVVGCEAAKVKSLVFQARSSLIETRNARETPCHEIREQLATASGGALRRGPLRRHLKHCGGCADFRDEVRRQRAMLAAAIPVIPSAAFKSGALASIGIGGGASAAGAGGGSAAGGGLLSFAGSSAASKAVAIIAVTGVTVGGGAAVTQTVVGDSPDRRDVAPMHRHPAPAATHGAHGPDARSRGEQRNGNAGTRGGAGERAGGRPEARSDNGRRAHGAPAGDRKRGGRGLHPHAQGSPLPAHVDNTPGTTGNGEQLPPPSNGGAGGGNSGSHNGATQGNRPSGDPGRSGETPAQSGSTGRPASPPPLVEDFSLPPQGAANGVGPKQVPPVPLTE